MTTIFNFMSLLTPFDPIHLKRIRIGNKGDGGYVMINDFDTKDKVALSFGVGDEISWDNHMASLGYDVFMFDHNTVPLPANLHQKCQFFPLGLTAPAQTSDRLKDLETHLNLLNLKGKEMILKLDIEGHEWETLSTLSPNILKRFTQIVVEFHEMGSIASNSIRTTYHKALSNLVTNFTVVHVHGNNFGSRKHPNISLIDGFIVPHTLEVTFLRKDRDQFSPSNTWFPTELDSPCCPRKSDIPLSFFSFSPNTAQENPLWQNQKNISFSFPPKDPSKFKKFWMALRK